MTTKHWFPPSVNPSSLIAISGKRFSNSSLSKIKNQLVEVMTTETISLSFFPEVRCWLVRELMWVWGCRLRLWLRVCESGQRCQCGWVRGFGWVRRLCLIQVDKFLSESNPMPSPSKHAQKVWKLTAFRTVNVGCTSRAGNEQWGRRTHWIGFLLIRKAARQQYFVYRTTSWTPFPSSSTIDEIISQ